MKLSIFTTMSNPDARMDPWRAALACYCDLADEVIVINGGEAVEGLSSRIKVIDYPWPEEFDWPFIGQQFQRGYDACTGDWVIRADLDYIFHERDMDRIRTMLAYISDDAAPAASFWKYQFLLVDRYQIKSRPVIALNKRRYGDRIKLNGGGDLCQPTLDGKEIMPEMVPEIKSPIYNYDFSFKTPSVVARDFARFAWAWKRHFKTLGFGGETEDAALAGFQAMIKGRYESRPHQTIALEDHPRYIRDAIASMTPDMLGHSLWGMTNETATYFK